MAREILIINGHDWSGAIQSSGYGWARSDLCRKVKTRGFLRNIPLSSFSFLCNEEICSISSNFTTALLFRPSAVNVALSLSTMIRI